MQKKVLMVIAFKDFRDEEYFVTKEILEEAGIFVQTASNETGKALGADGGEVKVEMLVAEISADSFDCFVIVGGPGCLASLDNEISWRLIKEACQKKKVLSAICIAPVILAKAGVLKGRRATVWNSAMDKSSVRILEDGGAIFQDDMVVGDDGIVTANGPAAASAFAQEIIKVLTTEWNGVNL